MATIDDAYLKAEQANTIVTRVETKVDSLTLYMEAYPAMTNPAPLTITLNDGVTTIDNLKKQSDKVNTQISNWLNPDPLTKVTYGDGSEGDNLAKIAQIAGADIHTHANKTILDNITGFKTINGTSILGSGDIVITSSSFSGNYNDLTNKPTFAKINNQDITNGGTFTLLTQVYDYVSATNPAANTNPSKDNTLWLNNSTGEIFVCTDRTIDANIWKGTNGTAVGEWGDLNPFGDNSQIAFCEFENNVVIDTMDNYAMTNGDGAGNNIVTFAPGKVGNCAVFNNNGVISTSLSISGDFSISVWLRPNVGCDGVSLSTTATASNGVNLYHNSGNTVVYVNNGSSHFIGSVPITSDGSTWTHLTLTHKNGVLTSAYKNGSLVNSVGSLIVGTHSTNLTIGAGGGNYWNGGIDQVRIFNKELTPDEVLAIYNQENS